MENKPLIIFVLGGPGAGKGTQCEKIVEKFGFKHLSAGELLREERRSGSPKGDLIETYIKDGNIVPVEITLGLLDTAMQKSEIKQFLIDGFPRNEDNYTGWNKIMANKVNFKFVLFFECSEKTCVERILERGKSSGRSDDNRESLVKRFQTYTNSTTPIIDHYRKDNLVRTIDAEASPDQVFEKVKELFQKECLS
ncbi:putative UMP-CMP kinase isoform X5 [Apostichopus japonicus]|uniref:UMP-CMP kinase n=1 Tax=Stichopus japonicus TaxID=307972 RepID=A0A2G8KMF1_STIJA|nr:putative UMP-CMP kinase isoform X5 [Apostichopus japonicus]